jgi:hypothetical protein
MIITEDNYFSLEVRNKYLDVSTFKDFVGTPAKEGCESRAMASLSGEYSEEKTPALLLGGLIDEMLLGTPESLLKFRSDNPELFSSRGDTKGQLKSEYRKVYQMVERCQQDAKFMKYLDGEHQKIMTGTLFGMDWRIKIDNYIEHKAIVDLKSMESIRKFYWSPEYGRCSAFIYFDYILQAAVYQEIVFQNTGERLPFYFNCVSKEPITDLEVVYVDNQTLHERIYGSEFSSGIAGDVQNIRLLMNKEADPSSCGKCNYCLPKKKIDRPIHFMDLEVG